MKNQSLSADELQRVKDFFKKNPGLNKFGRKESGLEHSYIKTPDAEYIKVSNKSTEGYVLGRGTFGRVKKTASKTAIKIQKFSTESGDELLEQLMREARINLDLKIATTNLIIHAAPEKGRVSFHQEMVLLQESVLQKVPRMSFSEKITTSIKILQLIQDLHQGKLSRSGQAYIHRDINLENIMYDETQNLRLIDFGYSEPLMDSSHCEEDIKQILIALFSGFAQSIFNGGELELLPRHIREVFLNTGNNLSILPPQERLSFIETVLIAYQENPALTSEEVEQIRMNADQRYVIHTNFEIKEKILKIGDHEVVKITQTIVLILEKDLITLDKLIEQSKKSSREEDALLFAQKREIIQNALILLGCSARYRPQETLIRVQKYLRSAAHILEQLPLSHQEKQGFLKRWLAPKIHSPHKIEKTIHETLKQDFKTYRETLERQKNASDKTFESTPKLKK